MSLVLSVEETNRLRERVGLRPIPVHSQKNGKYTSKEGGGGGGGGSDKGGLIIELSVAETNKLRQKVGLKPIYEDVDGDQELQNYAALQRNVQKTETLVNLKLKLDETKNEMKTNQRLASGGILDRINKGKSEVLDFDTWLETVGDKIKGGNIKKLQFKSQKQGTEKHSDSAEIKIAHSVENFSEALVKAKEIILTAKDVNVLDDANDEFENTLLKREVEMKSTHKEKDNRGKLVTLEDDRPSDGFVIEDGAKIKVSVKRQLESLDLDIDESDPDDDGKKINKFLKRDVSKFKKPKPSVTKRKTFDTVPVSKEFKSIKLDDIEDDEEIDELDKILEEQRKSIFNKSKVPITSSKSDTGKLNGDIFDERIDFIENLHVDDDSSKPKALEIVSVPDKSDDVGISVGSERYRRLLESEENQHNTLGVSEILSVLKSNGKKQQEKSESDVDITYTDDDGNVLSTKDAFKYMSRKFHGFKKK